MNRITRLCLFWLTLFSGAVLAGGCIVVHDDHDSTTYTTIDAGHELTAVLGEGAGVFVEYQLGGHWRVWTSCDTAITERSCDYEIHVTAAHSIDSVHEEAFEAGDHVDLFGADTLVFYAHTTTVSDAIELTTPAGERLQIEVVLDGVLAPDYLVWSSGGSVQEGATSSPVVFEPDAS
jgi:hypothetical protein